MQTYRMTGTLRREPENLPGLYHGIDFVKNHMYFVRLPGTN